MVLLLTLAERIQAQEFEHCFVLHTDGTITDAPEGIYAPECYHEPHPGDVDVSKPWIAITGMTGQDRYHGAVMHPSEYIGTGIAALMLEMVEDAPLIFAVVVVTDLEDHEDGSDDAVGWAIVYREVP